MGGEEKVKGFLRGESLTKLLDMVADCVIEDVYWAVMGAQLLSGTRREEYQTEWLGGFPQKYSAA